MSDNIAYLFPWIQDKICEANRALILKVNHETQQIILLLDSNQQMVTAKVEIQQAFFRGEGGVQ